MSKKPPVSRHDNKYSQPSSPNSEDLEAQHSSDEAKKPSFKAWSSGQRNYFTRYELIKDLVVQELRPFIDALKAAELGTPAKDTFNIIAKGLETEEGKKDGWQRFADEAAIELASKGEGWEEPYTQPSDIKTLKNTLRWSQKYELAFAAGNVYMAIHDYSSKLTPGQLGGASAYFFLQAIVSAFINYHGIDPDDATANIRPTIQIGNKIIDGTRVRPARKKEKAHITFAVDMEFFPDNPKYKPAKENVSDPDVPRFNAAKVEFFNKAFKLWLKQQKNYVEYSKTNTVFNSDLLNTISFESSNFHGAMMNWIGVAAIAGVLMSSEKSAPYLPLTLLFLPHITKAGRKYYVDFTKKAIEASRKTICTSEGPLAQTFKISKAQGIEAMLFQWLPNGISRGYGFNLNTLALWKFFQTFANPLFTIPDILINVYSAVTGGLAVHNTLLSRMKGAQKYLKPFTVQGFTGKLKPDGFASIRPLVIANPELLGELTELSTRETIEGMFFATISGLLVLGAPSFVLLWYGAGLDPSLSALAGLGLTIPPAITNYRAEKLHLQYTRARKAEDDKIKPPADAKQDSKTTLSPGKKYGQITQAVVEALLLSVGAGIGIYFIAGTDFIPLAIVIGIFLFAMKYAAKRDDQHYNNTKAETKSSAEIKGTRELGEDEVSSLNTISNLLDQASRSEALAGSTQKALLAYGVPDLGPWQLPLALNSILIKPRFNEFYTYNMTTLENVAKALNTIRAKAGTPIDKIIGAYTLCVIKAPIADDKKLDVLYVHDKVNSLKLKYTCINPLNGRAVTRVNMEPDMLYVNDRVNPLKYTCINPLNGHAVTGKIEESELFLPIKGKVTQDKATLQKLIEFLPDILEITYQRGHTFAEGRAIHFAARQMAFYFPYIFGRDVSGVSDQSWASWLCGYCSRTSNRGYDPEAKQQRFLGMPRPAAPSVQNGNGNNYDYQPLAS